MDRLTFKSDGYYAVSNEVCFEDQNEDYQGPAIDRLAAYEDTGLTPSEIDRLTRELAECRAEIAKYKEMLNG